MTADDTLFSTTTQLTYIIGIIGILYSTWKLMAAPGPGSGGLVLQPADQTSQAPPEDPPENPLHEPSVADVLVVKAMLIKALSLPPEIVDYLIDLAEYWPHTTAGISFESPTTVARGASPMENAFLLRSPPLGLHSWGRVSSGADNSPLDKRPLKPQAPGSEFSAEDFQDLIPSPITMLARPCRRIVFTITSKDQGWGGDHADHDTYNGSWTWFEAGVERWCKMAPAQTTDAGGQSPEPHQRPSLQLDDLCTVFPEVELSPVTGEHAFKQPLFPHEHLRVQCNVTAGREPKVHRVVWSYTDGIDPVRDVEAVEILKTQGRGQATGDGKFVRDLKLGDVVTLWAKARFPGWTNQVESATMDVYYAI